MTADSGTGLNSHMEAKYIKFCGIIGSWGWQNLAIFNCDICKMTADSGTRLNTHMKAKHVQFRGIIGI